MGLCCLCALWRRSRLSGPTLAAAGVDESAKHGRRIKTDGVACGVRRCRPVPCYTSVRFSCLGSLLARARARVCSCVLVAMFVSCLPGLAVQSFCGDGARWVQVVLRFLWRVLSVGVPG